MKQREIKFRGVSIVSGNWIYGCLFINEDMRTFIVHELITKDTYYSEVVYESVGQFTGRIDMNGNEIYEGDLVMVPYGNGKVEYASNQAMFIITWIDDREAYNESLAYEPKSYKYGRTRKDLEIIGNVFQNPELL
jgi:uncharacterized phage protein (TIGR01671 family)